jgi:Cu(I)/Ag(I) efflux system membrane fusion protein
MFTLLALVLSLPFVSVTRAADHGGHGAHDAGKPAVKAEDNRIYTANGVFESAEADGKATITHDPVPALGWPKMTMRFRPESPALLEGLKKGDRVRLDFRPQADGTPLLLHIEPAQ